MRRKLSLVAVCLLTGLSVGCVTPDLDELPPVYDAPPQVHAGLRPLVDSHLNMLKTKQHSLLFFTMPKRARTRFIERGGFWASIMGSAPMPRSVLDDMRLLEDVAISEWPLPGEKLPLYRLGSGRSVLVIYDMSCEDPGWLEPIPVRVVFRYAHDGEKWTLFGLRLKGPMFPQ